MKDKIIKFTDIPGSKQYTNPINTTPETVLESAKDKLSTVIVIGINKTDDSIYLASSSEESYELNFMIDMAKKRLLDLFES